MVIGLYHELYKMPKPGLGRQSEELQTILVNSLELVRGCSSPNLIPENVVVEEILGARPALPLW